MNGGDLLSLGILVVSGHDRERDLVREAASLASVPTESFAVERAGAAIDRLLAGGIDLVLIGHGVPGADKRTIVDTARARPLPPFVVALGNEGAGDGEALALDAPRPVGDVKALTAILKLCADAKLPKRALVVDDSATTRRIVRRILAASRFPLELMEAEEGGGALQKMKAARVDLVFLDYHMPGLNGADTLAALKRNYPRVPVVMMTATGDPAAAECARAAGAAFLKKPFFPAEIDAVLDGLFGLRSLARAA